MEKLMFAMLAFASMTSLHSLAQEVKFDVHTGANLSGFVGGNSAVVQDRKMKLGATVGTGVSYETDKRFVFSSGIDFLMTAGQYTVLSDYLTGENQMEAFPSVNSREVSVQIPVKFGYDLTLGKNLRFIPSVGVYGRYSLSSIKEKVTESADGTSENSFKWNCFKDYRHNTNHLDAYRRWDVGGLVEGKFVFANRYNVTIGYSHGFINKSTQFNFKTNSYYLTLGYTL